jgi:hypothetical protein
MRVSKIFRSALALVLVGVVANLMAQTSDHRAEVLQAQSIGSTVGKSLGMLLFGYIVLRLFNRPREGEDTARPWRIGILLVVLLFMVGLWLSR